MLTTFADANKEIINIPVANCYSLTHHWHIVRDEHPEKDNFILKAYIYHTHTTYKTNIITKAPSILDHSAALSIRTIIS